MSAQDTVAPPAAFDATRLAQRVRALLFTPKQAWPPLAAEPATTAGLYAGHAMVLAAIPAVAGFLKGSVIGFGVFGATLRTPILSGLVLMFASYALGLVLLYAVGRIINALAPTFGARKDPVQALKTATYAWTAAWICGAGIILPGIGMLLVLAGLAWSGYLLYLALPHTMQCPQEKAVGYAAASMALAIVASWACALLLAGIGGVGTLTGAIAQDGAFADRQQAEVTFDKDSPLGRLAAVGEQLRDPGKATPAADPDALKAVLPEAIGDYARSGIEARHSGGLGLQMSMASATYVHPVDHRRIVVTITDSSAAGALMSMAGAAGLEQERESADGYERTYTRDGTQVHEKWEHSARNGEYAVWVDDRFQVEVRGQVDSFDELEAIAEDLDLSSLASR